MVRGREQPPSWYATPRGDLQPVLLSRVGLVIFGQVRHDRKPWWPWIMWLGGLHGCIDDCGMWKLTLSMALVPPPP